MIGDIIMEKNKRECKVCYKLKDRILKGKFKGCKDKQWIDKSGSCWNGKICPDCNRVRVMLVMRNKRDKQLTNV